MDFTREQLLESSLKQADDVLVTARSRAIQWKYNRFAQVLDIVWGYCNENSSTVLVHNVNRVAAHVRGELFYPIDPVGDLGLVLLTQTPQLHARAIVDRILRITKYVSIMSFAFGKEQVISVENERLVQVNMLFEETLEKFSIESNLRPIKADISWPLTSSVGKCSLAPVAISWLISLRSKYNPDNIVLDDSPVPSDPRESDSSDLRVMADLANQLGKKKGKLDNHVPIVIVPKTNIIRSEDACIIRSEDACIIGSRQRSNSSGHSSGHLVDMREVEPIIYRVVSDMNPKLGATGGPALNASTVFAGKGINGAMHIITPSSIDLAKLIIQALSSFGKGRYQLNRNFIMDDFRLKRVTIHLETAGGRKHIASIFNSTDYEVIPSTLDVDPQGLSCLRAHPLVELRLWLYSLVMQRFYNQGDMHSLDWGWVESKLRQAIAESTEEHVLSLVWAGSVRDEKIDKVKMGINVWRPRA